MSCRFQLGRRWVAMLVTLLAVQSFAEEQPAVTSSIGGVRIGAEERIDASWRSDRAPDP